MPSPQLVRLQNSIALQLFIVVFSVYLLMTLIFTTLQIVSEYTNTKEEIIQELEVFEATFQPRLTEALKTLDQKQIESSLVEMMNIPIIVGVQLQQNDLNLVQSRGIVPEKKKDSVSTENPNHFLFSNVFGHTFELAVEEKDQRLKLGEVTLYSSATIIFEKLEFGIYFTLLNVLAKVIVLSVLFLWIGRKMLTYPLFRLATATEQIQLENLEHLKIQLHTTGRNELKILEETSNAMIHKLLVARKELEDRLYSVEKVNYRRTTLLQGTQEVISVGNKFMAILSAVTLLLEEFPIKSTTIVHMYFQEFTSEEQRYAHFHGPIGLGNQGKQELKLDKMSEVSHEFLSEIAPIKKRSLLKSSKFQTFVIQDTLSIPLEKEDEVFGWIDIVGIDRTQIREENLEFADTLSSFLTIALQDLEFTAQLESSLAEKTSELEKAYAALEKNYKDPLTGCSNKNKFYIDLEEKHGVVLIYMKINKFNEINDGLGFEAGNHVLREVSKILQKAIPDSANLYHFDGSEFGVLLSDTTEEAMRLSELMKDSISFAKITFAKSRIVPSLSCGIAPDHLGDVFRNAHLALGEAKKHRKTIIFTKELAGKSDHKRLLQQTLSVQEAFEANLFFPVFQGIRDNRKDSPYYQKINKFECLIRISSADKAISPYFFMNALERSGEMTKATRLIMMKSCQRMSSTSFDFSINLTETDLIDETLIDFVKYQLEENKIDPSRVTFEILEGIGDTEDDMIMKNLTALKSLGCKLAIDDFGAEQSNISRLLALTPDFIKIDAKFIKNIASDHKSRIIVENVFDLATRMNAEVVAEYVENIEIQEIIEEIGIQFSQGYLFSKPNENLPSTPQFE